MTQDRAAANSTRALEAQARQELPKNQTEEFSLSGDPNQVWSHHIDVGA